MLTLDMLTLELPQVCKLWLAVGKGMLHVRHLAPKILMAVNYCGRQLPSTLGWAATAFHKKEGATSHPGACKHSLQYDRRHDERFWVRLGT